MSTNVLPRIAEIAAQLEPLGRKETGQPIGADDWNKLVAALLGILSIERQQEEGTQSVLAEQFARKEHDHKGAVSLDWLDADLRGRIGEGTSALTERLAAVEKKIAQVAADLRRIDQRHDRLLTDFDNFTVVDADRAKIIRSFEGRFSEATDVAKRVNALAADFDAVKTTVAAVNEFRSSLSDAAGNRIDVAKISADVQDLQVLRESLKGADGKPLRVLDLQLKVNELADIAGAGEGLEHRFDVLGSEVEHRVFDKTREHITDVRKQLAEEQQHLVETTVSLKVGEAETRLGAATDARVKDAQRQLSTDLSASLLDQVRRDQEPRNKAVDEKLADIEPRVTRAITGARADIENAVRTSLTPRVTADIQNGLRDVETRLGTRIATTEKAFETFTVTIPAKIADEVKNETLDLRDTLTEQVKTTVAEARTIILTQIPTAVKDATTTALANLDTRISGAVGAQIGDLGTRVKKEVEDATRDLNVQVDTAVREEVAALNIDAKIAAASTQTTNAFRAELQSAITNERTQVSKDIGAATIGLRGEIQAAVAVGRRGAVEDARTLIEARSVNPGVIRGQIVNPHG